MKKQILIIDNRDWFADRLKEKFQAFDSEIVIYGPAKTCAEARDVLLARDDYNLIFSCFSLPDGDLLGVFRETRVRSFVIFTTLPDEHSRRLLEKLRRAYLLGAQTEFTALDVLDWLWQASLRLLGICGVEETTTTLKHKERLLVRYKRKLVGLSVREVMYCKRMDDYVQICMVDGRKYLCRDSIQNLRRHLDPDLFFSPNRKYLVNRYAVEGIKSCDDSLCVVIKYCNDDSVIVSRNRITEFTDWKNRGTAKGQSAESAICCAEEMPSDPINE